MIVSPPVDEIWLRDLGRGGRGRLGNQLWQIASALGLGRRLGVPLRLPDNWTHAATFPGLEPYVGSPNAPHPTHLRAVETYPLADGVAHVYECGARRVLDLTNCWLQDRTYWWHCRSHVVKTLSPDRNRLSRAQPAGETFVHVRVGDYQSDQNPFACIGPSFYRRAVDRLGASQDEITLVTDSPEHVEDCFRSAFPRARIIKSTEADDFRLLVGAAKLVIANSTFSYWAATLGTGVVVAPACWTQPLNPDSKENARWRRNLLPHWGTLGVYESDLLAASGF